MLTVCLITPGDLAILLSGYRYHTGDQPGRAVRHAHRDEAKVGRLNRSADMFVLLSWDSRHNILLPSRDRYMTLGWDNPTADPTTSILLRHGDTRLSPEHRFSGLRDLPLSASGIRQAKAAACRLATGAPIDAVVSSPLQRAVDTAAIAAAELGLTAVTDDDLRETDFGDWDGFTLAEIQQRWPAAAAAWRRDPEQAPPGGESFAETAHRVNRACDRLLRDHGGQTVLVVSHVTPIKILLCRALGVPLGTIYRLYLGSACINEIQWHGRGFAAVHRVNDTSHLR
jgi:probable phosphoglycerate mutase